jgi:hypothetical protein
LRRAVGKGFELVVALAREVDLRIAVAVEVLARDAHSPDLERLPAVGRGVQAWLFARDHLPELLLAAAVVAVVVAVVADAEVAPARAVPIAE